MNNYKQYSRNAFIDHLTNKDNPTFRGFGLYAPNGDIAIFVNRYGVAYVWKFENDQIVISHRVLVSPKDLKKEDFDWLENVAREKGWRGGVHKIHYYKRHIGEEMLSVRGIDPFFYAWMIERDYLPNTDVENTILNPSIFIGIQVSQDEYDTLSQLCSVNGLNFENELDAFSNSSNTFEEWLGINFTDQERYLLSKVRAFVKSVLPVTTDKNVVEDAVAETYNTLWNVLYKYD